ncbi:MAG: sulfur carrier protein ThiS [Firmicutes bacterium ADurb.Bin419]|nr:MAG: sulfur carrier protein ThiS [Firmicutes bacterium ADurb.Bin419]
MNITLNGKRTELEKAITVAELLELKKMELERVIVEYNYDILVKDDWKATLLNEGDNIEVLKFVGGG